MEKYAKKYSAEGYRVVFDCPVEAGKDWNDVVCGERAAEETMYRGKGKGK